jgi:AAA domain
MCFIIGLGFVFSFSKYPKHCNFAEYKKKRRMLFNIIDIHEEVLAFLLQWREKKEPNIMFTLRRRPIERLEAGMWFLGNDGYLAFSFWTGLDWINKTQNIYCEINTLGEFKLRLSGKDHPDKAAILGEMALILGGFVQYGKNSIWTKEYPGVDYIGSLEKFLLEDRPRINAYLSGQKRNGSPVFDDGFAFNTLDHRIFADQLNKVKEIRSRKTLPTSQPPRKPKVKELWVSEVTLTNTGQFGKCTLALGKRATCLIGENGGGKTTILRAIAIGLVGTGSPLIQTDGELQNLPRIVAADEKGVLTYASDGSVNVSYHFDGEKFDNGRSNLIQFKKSEDSGSVIFGGDRVDVAGFGLPIGNPEEEGFDGDGLLPTLVLGYPQRYGKKRDGTNPKKRTEKRPNAYDIIPLIYEKTEDNRIETLKIWIAETWNSSANEKESVKSLFTVISRLLSTEGEGSFVVTLKSAVSSDRIIVTTPLNPDGIPFELLSTGLNNLFGWIGHLISRMYEAYSESEHPVQESAVVLVDEVDNYLHPLVQAKTIPILLDFFPKVQFIITSHSAVVLATLPNKDVKAFRVDKGEVFPIEYFYGRTIEDILSEEYGLVRRPATEIEDMFDDLFLLIRKGQINEAKSLLENLASFVGEKDEKIKDAKYKLSKLN